MSSDNGTIIFYRRLSDKHVVYTILVCSLKILDMTSADFLNLMKGQPYTASLTNARRLAQKIDREKRTRNGVKECTSFLDVDESLLVDSSFEFGVSEEKESDSVQSTPIDSQHNLKFEPTDELLSGSDSLHSAKCSIRGQIKSIQERELTLTKREQNLASRTKQLLLQEKELAARMKELKNQESLLSLGYILSSFDLTPDELQQAISALKSHRSVAE